MDPKEELKRLISENMNILYGCYHYSDDNSLKQLILEANDNIKRIIDYIDQLSLNEITNLLGSIYQHMENR